MKKFFILLGVVLGNLVFAQTPQFIHYQAVIRDGNGAVLSNQTVSLKIEITQGQNTYTEIRTVNTNNVGLVNLSIGNLPAPNSIPFSSINWAGGSTSMLTWYDPTGSGSNWQYISSSDIASVPYALHAANVFSGDFNDLTNIPTIDSSNTNEIQTISAQGDTIYLSNGGQIYYGRFSGNFADLNGVPAIDTSYTNELQTIAMSGDTISLSNGGGSVVVNTFSGDFNDLSNVPNIDTSNTNELQVLSMSGDTLYLSNGGFAVIPVDKWSESNDVVYRNSRVGINSINPDAQLEVNSPSSTSNSQLGLSITRSVSNNGWGVPLKFNLNDNTGQRYRYGQITGGITSNSGKMGFLSFSVADGNNWGIAYEQEMMRLTPTGLAIGHSSPIRTLHVNGAIRLNPMVSAPSGGAKGDIYVDANGSINFFNGTKWVNTQQVLELSGDTLKLRDGGSVLLPLSSKAEMLDDLGDAKTDNASLGLGWNALHSMDSTAFNNVAVGEYSLENIQGGGDNTAVGTRSMRSTTNGGYNTGIGFEALYSNSTGFNNTALGNNSMWENVSGNYNTAVGSHSLYSNNFGTENTAIGANSLQQSISSWNTAVGYNALQNAVTGQANDAFGSRAGKHIVHGSQNVAIGSSSLFNLGTDTSMSEQHRNTALGAASLHRLVGGSNNIGIGNEAGAWITSGSNNIIIGGVDGPNGQAQRSISGNVIIGRAAAALISNNSSNNTILGTEAGTSVHNNHNTIIGYKANVGDSSIYNSVAIGSNSEVTESNMVVLGGNAVNKVFTSGSLSAGNMQNSQQQAGVTIFGSSNGPSSPTGKFIRASNRNNVLVFEDETASVAGSIGLLSPGFKGENFIAVSTYDTLHGWSRPLAIELGAETDLLELRKNSTIEMVDGVLIHDIQDTGSLSQSAALEIKSNTKGFLPPRMTDNERDAILNPEAGLVLYCTNCGDFGELQVFNGQFWANLLGDTAQNALMAIPTSGLLGYWPFNSNANDVSGNQKHGTLYNNPIPGNNRFGTANSAYYFDWTDVTGYGSNWQKIEIPSINASNEFTINAWIKSTGYCWPNNSIKSAMIVGNSAACCNSTGGIRFNLSGNSGDIGFSHNGIGGTSVTGPINLNSWQMVTLTVTASSAKIYVDGILVSNTQHNVTPGFNSCLSVGLHHQGNGHWYYFKGGIDDLSIWDRALSENEIEALLQSAK